VSIQQEANEICNTLQTDLVKKWDGKDCILELKKANGQWKQMEWVGWFFEFKAFQILTSKLGGTIGPKYGNTTFDYMKSGLVWDFKSHIKNASSHPWAILNDSEAVDACISNYNSLGFVIAEGTADYDEDGSFKSWHDALKGGKSDYEKERIRRGAPSRKRKISLNVERFRIIYLTKQYLQDGIAKGWINYFQKNMRNANGSARRNKYMINVGRIPSDILLGCGRLGAQTTLGS
jgi:uncharacterized protein YeeX (DUF496 family)